jgi:hypothetical protein
MEMASMLDAGQRASAMWGGFPSDVLAVAIAYGSFGMSTHVAGLDPAAI